MSVRFPKVLLAAVLAAVLAGCGGGGGASTTVSGTAATGAAIASGTVTMHCVAGTPATTSTLADGSFTVDAGTVTFPCLARVSYKDAAGASQQLHTYVGGPGLANITPITELIVASLLGTTPAQAYDAFDAAKVQGLTAAKITAALAAVKTYLQNLGVAVTDFPADPIGSRFVAKAGTVDGDKADKLLDDLQAKLKAAGLKIADATDDVSKGVGTTGTTTAGGEGCTGAAATAFAASKGTYATLADIYTPGSNGSTVLGFADRQSTTVVIAENCTVRLGNVLLTYKSGTLTTAGGEINVGLTGQNLSAASGMDLFSPGTGVVQVGDTVTGGFANFFFPPSRP